MLDAGQRLIAVQSAIISNMSHRNDAPMPDSCVSRSPTEHQAILLQRLGLNLPLEGKFLKEM